MHGHMNVKFRTILLWFVSLLQCMYLSNISSCLLPLTESISYHSGKLTGPYCRKEQVLLVHRSYDLPKLADICPYFTMEKNYASLYITALPSTGQIESKRNTVSLWLERYNSVQSEFLSVSWVFTQV
jgi:hypothetical protein